MYVYISGSILYSILQITYSSICTCYISFHMPHYFSSCCTIALTLFCTLYAFMTRSIWHEVIVLHKMALILFHTFFLYHFFSNAAWLAGSATDSVCLCVAIKRSLLVINSKSMCTCIICCAHIAHHVELSVVICARNQMCISDAIFKSFWMGASINTIWFYFA